MNTRNTTRAQWLALAERAEKATGPDRDIDCEIAVAVGDPWDYSVSWRGWGVDDAGVAIEKPVAFPYTRSLDAITALIERELPGWDWSTARSHGHCRANVWRLLPISRGSFPPRHATAATPALALCAAFCRAMAEKADA